MSPRPVVLPAILAVLTIAPMGSAVAQAIADTPLAAVERLFEGMRTADSAMVRSVLADGVRFASVDTRATPATIRYDAVDGWLAGIAGSNRRWDERIYDVEVKVDGDIAFVWAPYTFYLDKAVRHCGVDAIDLLKDGAGWKITQLADTRRRESCRDVPAK